MILKTLKLTKVSIKNQIELKNQIKQKNKSMKY